MRLTSEIGQLRQAALELQDAPLLELQWAELRSLGLSVEALKETAQREEDMKRSSEAMRVEQLRVEVAERQSHFDRMTDDLLDRASTTHE